MEKQIVKYCVGIDISKEKFDVSLVTIDTIQHVSVKGSRKFTNNSKGFKEFVDWVSKKCKLEIPLRMVMEATGVYYEELAYHLSDQDYKLSVILPNKAKQYLRSLGLKSKNDTIDARGLATMGAERNLELWDAPSEWLRGLRLLTRHRRSLQDKKTSVSNQQEAFMHSHYKNKMVGKQIKSLLRLYDKQIAELDQHIEEYIQKDARMQQKITHLSSIQGIGFITAAIIVAETNGFALFKNRNQLVSYAGYDVVENQSGKHVGKTKISKKGNSHIRAALFFPALTASQYNPVCKALKERVTKRTGMKMKGVVAVQRKLLTLMFALWKNNQPYDLTIHQKGFSVMVEESSSLGSAEGTKKAGAPSAPALDELSYKGVESPLWVETKVEQNLKL